MWDIALGLGISALPTRASLTVFRTLGFSQLVNVSGTSMAHLYSERDLSGFNVAEFPFIDAFSTAIHAAAITEVLGPDGLLQVKMAVQHSALQLRLNQRVMVFCHLGVGRSPAVSTMALMLARRWPAEEALRVVLKLRPRAVLNQGLAAFATTLVTDLAVPK